ncbi:MAG TPA: hypothetical protein VK622_10150 [Puia sp.]|nr:hypothetical protein [Puia sp.]
MILKFELTPRNWYKDRIETELHFIENFLKNVEHQIWLGIKDFENCTIETYEENDDWEAPDRIASREYMGVDGLTWDLDDLFKSYYPNLQRGSAFITLHAFLENELIKLCDLIQKQNGLKIKLNDLRKDSSRAPELFRVINYLDKVEGLAISNADFESVKLKDLTEIRNVFAHQNGIFPVSEKDNFERIGREFTNHMKIGTVENNSIALKETFLKFALDSYREIFVTIDKKLQLKYG